LIEHGVPSLRPSLEAALEQSLPCKSSSVTPQ
jgi:hypothetical protein